MLDDTVTTFSSRGPTRFDLTAKPDLLAPGNRVVSVRSVNSTLDLQYPGNRVAGNPSQPWDVDYFELSGTSMAAPVVAGAAALMLEQNPALNPATVKARLMRSARKPAVADPFAAGAGALDILAALRETDFVNEAPSPKVIVGLGGELSFENTGFTWSSPLFSLPTLWGSAVLWSESTPDPDVLTSYAVLMPASTATALMWPPDAVSPTATLWPESTLWSEAVLWPDADFAIVEILGTPVPDP